MALYSRIYGKAKMAHYVETKTRVKTIAGISQDFDIGVGVHQGSILSPSLFIVVMDEVTKKVRNGVPWELGYADDLVKHWNMKHWKDLIDGEQNWN